MRTAAIGSIGRHWERKRPLPTFATFGGSSERCRDGMEENPADFLFHSVRSGIHVGKGVQDGA